MTNEYKQLSFATAHVKGPDKIVPYSEAAL